MNTQTAHVISATDVEEHTRDKGNCTGIISAAVQPSMPFMPQSQEVQVRVTSSEDQTLPLYLCLEDYHNGMKPIGNIPETLGRLLLRSEIIGWTDKDPKAGLILEYWRESTEDHMLVNPLGLGEGCWVIPADRMAECSECVTEHMKRFVELCEEALDLPQSKESDQHVNVIVDGLSAVYATRPERQKALPDGSVVAFALPIHVARAIGIDSRPVDQTDESGKAV